MDYCQSCLNPGCTKDGLCERCRERVRAVAEEFKLCRPELSGADRVFMRANAQFCEASPEAKAVLDANEQHDLAALSGIPERHQPS